MTPLDPTVKSLISDPYGAYAALRAEAPVHRVTGPDGLPVRHLLRRFPDLALDTAAEELRHRPALRARGLLELPVRIGSQGREPA
ncbi:hypothetical protein ACFY2K_31010 [Kitasatospora sp. NPDC001309]|uniref:hypothetical protein n=1 Tax=unclassified Kitasatospora TaxID=2633591 RepID=UPI0036AEA719